MIQTWRFASYWKKVNLSNSKCNCCSKVNILETSLACYISSFITKISDKFCLHSNNFEINGKSIRLICWNTVPCELLCLYQEMTKNHKGDLVSGCQITHCTLTDSWAVLWFLYCGCSLLSISFHCHLHFVVSSPVNKQLLLANTEQSESILFLMHFEVFKTV